MLENKMEYHPNPERCFLISLIHINHFFSKVVIYKKIPYLLKSLKFIVLRISHEGNVMLEREREREFIFTAFSVMGKLEQQMRIFVASVLWLLGFVRCLDRKLWGQAWLVGGLVVVSCALRELVTLCRRMRWERRLLFPRRVRCLQGDDINSGVPLGPVP